MEKFFNFLKLNFSGFMYKFRNIHIKESIGSKEGDSKKEFEKDILKLLKKWNIHPSGKGIQKIDIKCTLEDLPVVNLIISKYWDDQN